MNTRVDAERQGQPVGLRRPQAQLVYGYVADALEDALSDIADGACVRAADRLRLALDHIREEAKAEAAALANLSGYRAIFEIDLELHRTRHKVLQQLADKASWDLTWDGDAAILAYDGSVLISVDRNDNWSAASGTSEPDFCGIGLVSLLANFSGEHPVITATRLSKWLDARGVAK